MTCWANLVAQPKPSSLTAAQQLSDIKYTAPSQLNADTGSERTVITSESRGLILASGTTGFRTWEAALHLGSFLATPAGEVLVRGKRVIELGAGTGFLSLFCARHLGVRGVVSSDREIALIDNMKRCKSLNQLDQPGKAPFCPAVWEWGTPLEQRDEMEEFVEDGHINFDVALGADLVSLPPGISEYQFLYILDLRHGSCSTASINNQGPVRELQRSAFYHRRYCAQ